MSGILTRRELNRATLARQLLLERSDLGVLAAIEQLAGMQAQSPHAPYTGLWSRLRDFDPAEVGALLEDRRAVRVSLMRSTIHLVSAADALAWRPALQVMHEKALLGSWRVRLGPADPIEVGEAGRLLVEERPRTFKELSAELGGRWPTADPDSLAAAVRTYVPLVQVPPRGVWGRSMAPTGTSLQHWLGRPLGEDVTPDAMVRRYLAAFGPATQADIRAWSRLTRIGEAVDRIQAGPDPLRVFHDDRGRELLDVADAPLPPADTPAPVRFLPEFDNVLLSHEDRSRVIPPRHRETVQHNLGKPMLLVDGEARASWSVGKGKQAGTMTVVPFDDHARGAFPQVEAEGMELLRLLAPDARKREVLLA